MYTIDRSGWLRPLFIIYKKVIMPKTKQVTKKTSHILFIAGLLAIVTYGILVVYDIYFQESRLFATVQTDKQISKGDKVIVDFSTAVNGRFDLRNIDIEPPLKIKPRFLSNKQVELKILGVPMPNQKYTVTFHKVPTFWLGFTSNQEVNLMAVSTPGEPEVYPGDGQNEVGYNEKIKINLKQPLDKHFFLEVDINPDKEVITTMNKSRNEIVLTPKADWAKAQKYDLSIVARYRDDENFRQELYRGSFVTKIPPKVVYNFSKNGEVGKTEDITWELKPRIMDGKYIDIDLTHQVLSIFEDGLRKGSYKVSSGKRGMNTPTGTFHILSKGRRPWSAHYGLYMPWYMGFTTKGHGIHELPEWPGGYKEGANHLGIPVSHGCVRLGVGPAKLVFDFASKGTPVVVHY